MEDCGTLANALTGCGAVLLADRIRRGDVSAREVVEASIRRIEEINPRVNALVVPMLQSAREVAAEADQRQARGLPLGPLHGVPVSIKECFAVVGTPATIGLPGRRHELAVEDAVLVRRLRAAGAVIVGKTNVPLLMLSHECDNPVYGGTNNPWDVQRTPGGSSGGEAALIASGGVPLGLGSDLGGSLRVPALFCGIQALKPTSGRLTCQGVARAFLGMNAIQFQPGPLGRRVEDLELALQILAGPEWSGPQANGPGTQGSSTDVPPRIGGASTAVDPTTLRIGVWNDDPFFPVSPAIGRAVASAASVLSDAGLPIEIVRFPTAQWFELYVATVGADGGGGARRLLRGNVVDRSLGRLLRVASIPGWLRPAVSGGLRLAGQQHAARLVAIAGSRSADEYWQLTQRVAEAVEHFEAMMARDNLDVLLCPAFGTPAPRHGAAQDLLPAACYSFLPNLLGAPCGLVTIGRVGPDEQSGRPASRDWSLGRAIESDTGSAGLPIGVQVVARHWREDHVLAVMRMLEAAFENQADYPGVAPG
jgi:fatty acid amide hydrolase